MIWFREFKTLEDTYNAQNMLHSTEIYTEILKEYFGEEAAADFINRGNGLL